MSTKLVMFDLDGTLLPMDQEEFVTAYLRELARKLAPHGYEPEALVKAIWSGTAAMVKNDGSRSNEEAFWTDFERIFGAGARADEPLFAEFYEHEFGKVREVCGFDARAAECIKLVHEKGMRAALATNPIFPAVATLQRIIWAGLEPEDFELITTYENSGCCKPNPDYYREVLGKLGVDAADCVMVGNDVAEDMIAETLGARVFLLTDCMINKNDEDISVYPHGGYDELLRFIAEL